jgi:hypothetical protein
MILNVKMLPDKSGRVLIHWLQEDVYDASKLPADSLKPLARLVDQADKGDAYPIKIQGHPQLRRGSGQATVSKARIACNPTQNSVNPQHKGQEVFMCMHSNDVRAVTCPKCLATVDAAELLKQYEDTMEIAQV